jgi:hypothetical protein
LEFGGNNGDNNNGDKTGAIHGPLIDEGISLVAFGGFRYWGLVGCLVEFFFFFLNILRYRWVCLIRHVRIYASGVSVLFFSHFRDVAQHRRASSDRFSQISH